MESKDSSVRVSAAKSPSSTKAAQIATNRLFQNSRDGNNDGLGNRSNRGSSEVSSSAFTESLIFNQSANEALIDVLKKRGVPEEIYHKNVARMIRRKNLQKEEQFTNFEDEDMSVARDLLEQGGGVENAHTSQNFVSGTFANNCNSYSDEDKNQVRENGNDKTGHEGDVESEKKNEYSHFGKTGQDVIQWEHSDIKGLDEQLHDELGEYDFHDIDSLIDSNKDDEEYQEISSELDYSDRASEYESDDSDNIYRNGHFEGLYLSKDGRIVSAEEYMREKDQLKQYMVVTKRKVQWKRVISLLSIVFCFLLFSAHSVYQFQTVKYLDKQIHEIYHDRMELDKTVNVILQQVENKMKNLFHSNRFTNSNTTIVPPLNITEIELSVYKQVESGFLNKLADFLPSEIPVIIKKNSKDDQNKILILPEFEQLFRNHVVNFPAKNTSKNALEFDETLQKTMNQYIKEVLLNEYQFVDKQFFVHELYKNINDIKTMFLHESEKFGDLQYKYNLQDEVFVRNLIQQEIFKEFERKTLYDRNGKFSRNTEQDCFNELDYATFSSGTRVINNLCSKTFKGLIDKGVYPNGIGPVDLLRDTELASLNDRLGNNNFYWFCDITKGDNQYCQWTARFHQPIYLHRIAYQHGRFKHNLSLMNSAPKTISLYVKIQDKTKRKQLTASYRKEMGAPIQLMYNDRSFIKVCNMSYDISNMQDMSQFFQLPAWFLKQKPLVKGISFVVENSYGNPYYIAMNKFVVNGFTPYDLELMALSASSSFSSNNGDFATSGFSNSNDEQSDSRYPSFGDDDEVI